MNFKSTSIQPPSAKENLSLRLMICIGLLSIVFFLYSMLQKNNISYFPLYILLMITMVFYCLKYLHEWYHYFSISTNKKPVTDKIYTVDILTTYCAGEPFEMLERTLIAIQNIKYPHTAWCCDEADDPKVKQLCLSLGVRHVTRIVKIDAKAGNINNALKSATGELCVVLDPDHIPAPEFLDQIVAYFDDTTIGFVQVVQAYYNQEESLVAKGAAQQTYQFYGPMMMAMNTYGTVQAIGANCTFRRKALDSIGGHANGLAEDMHTAMQLHANGWRSVYVPIILSRGLVPATMSSYYKQQLKWSRGTWELLFTTYPKLFNKFSWRQKLHYLTLPFHYLSGFIFFINFLIPIISLFTGDIPLQMDMLNFLLAAIPLFTMSIIIRHFVQKWVAEESERGFHLVGGILQIGTWWIHSIGVVYTIIRKKVPYIPTPKNDKDAVPILLNLPNILIALISIIAIVYGLWYDYTPYTIFMAFLAAMQVLFMIFILSISGYIGENNKINNVLVRFRQNTWLIIKAHGFLRKFSVPLSLLLIIVFVISYLNHQQLPSFLPKPLSGRQVFYRGLHQPNGQNDTNTKSIFSIAAKRKDIAIIAIDIPWGEGEKNKLDTAYLKQLFGINAIPLLAWQPWQRDSATNEAKDISALQHILEGKYDKLILSFATQVAQLNKPVFLYCCNQPVQNKYPLFAYDNSLPVLYIAAWQYIHRLFDKAGANMVIWIWTPRNAITADEYFPGNKYVDWLGINMAQIKPGKSKSRNNSFDSIYRPFHQLPLFKSGLPVMLNETIEYSSNPSSQWWDSTWNIIDTAFKEIKSVIIDVSKYYINKDVIEIATPVAINTILTNAPLASMPLEIKQIDLSNPVIEKVKYGLPFAMKSIVYNKGYYWFRNKHTLNLRTLETDIEGMKKIGVNTVERMMPGFYDDKLHKVLVSKKMNLIPILSVESTPEILKDDREMQLQKDKILQVIKNNLNEKNIVAWKLGDDVLYNLANQSYQPDFFYYRQKYITWLSEVCMQIRILDTVRPIVMNLHWDEKGRERYHYYKKHVPQINAYMLEADSKYKQCLSEPLEEGMTWGKVAVELWPLIPAIRESGTIPAWQDIENTNFVALDGLLDLEGRKKQWYGQVANLWANIQVKQSPIPDINILKPARIIWGNPKVTYQVVHKKDNSQWKIYKGEVKDVRFEWYLVRIDQYDNTMFIKKVGEGVSLELEIPMDPQYYHLYLQASSGDETKMVHSTLNTPLE